MPELRGASRIFVYQPSPVLAADFVAYWEPLYSKRDKELDYLLYLPNIKGPHTLDTLKALFRWKIGKRFFETHWPNIERAFIARMDLIRALSDVTPDFFLNKMFPDGGAIYRIFWLHCWFPTRYPIYDQHVHRAMIFIQEGRIEELDTFSDAHKISFYLNKYFAFNSLFHSADSRMIDRALFAFGKFIKHTELPLPP